MSAIDLAAPLIDGFESDRLEAYQDIKGIWTIGRGHTGPEVVAGLVWTQAQSDAAFAADLAKAESAVVKLRKRLLSDKQTAALISFVFNLGAGALAGSQLLVAVNDCRWIDVAHAFVNWDHAGHTEIKGLLIRRLQEAALFLQGS